MGEYRKGTVQAAGLRPLPNSRVFPLPPDEARRLLRTDGDLALGVAAVGQHEITVNGRTDEKIGFPRHTAILGTTGGGKSTTVSGMVARAQEVGVASIILDVEGEYAAMYEPTDDEAMRVALEERGLAPKGAANVSIYALTGRESKCPDPKRVNHFSLTFSELSPYAVVEILDFNDAQQQRFWTAYELTKRILRETKIYPNPANSNESAEALLVDELEEGWPRMKLGHIYDVVRCMVAKLDKAVEPAHLTTFEPNQRDKINQVIDTSTAEGNKFSWMAVLGRLGSLHRLKIFDQTGSKPLNLSAMISKPNISIIDLSDTESPNVRNLAIAQILRNVQLAQDARYEAEQSAGHGHKPTLVVIEEAHEFVSSQRVRAMPTLFAQLARIAKRGRKRWLSLVFVTQLPQHLPDEVLGLVNSWVLHRISDNGVVTRLRKSVGSIDGNLWDRVSTLAPGQSIVSLTTMRRALITRILPTPCRLLMAD
jgi:DNA helicase HerA-like ATPase